MNETNMSLFAKWHEIKLQFSIYGYENMFAFLCAAQMKILSMFICQQIKQKLYIYHRLSLMFMMAASKKIKIYWKHTTQNNPNDASGRIFIIYWNWLFGASYRYENSKNMDYHN